MGEAAVRLSGGKDPRALMDLAQSHHAAGDRARAGEYARKAVAAAAGEPATLKEAIERDAKALEDGKKEDKS